MSGSRIIDPDTHVIESPDLWTARLPRSWGDRRLHVKWDPDLGREMWCIGDRRIKPACAVGADNTITCWGANESGQADAPDGQYTAVSAGDLHTCALGVDNTIVCWGYDGNGRAGAPDGQYTAVTAGGFHTCALGVDNTITCWPTVPNGVRWATGDG